MTKGGTALPERPRGKALQAAVVAAGSGSKGEGGQIPPGQFPPEYRDTKAVLDDKVLPYVEELLFLGSL